MIRRHVLSLITRLTSVAALLLVGCAASAESSGETATAATAAQAPMSAADSAAMRRRAMIDSLDLAQCAGALAAKAAADSVAADSARADSLAAAAAAAASDTTSVDSIVARSAPQPVVRRDTLWPVEGPRPIAGAVLPGCRIVAYYGNPLSKRMGILGELPPEQMLQRLDREIEAWAKADPATPVIPALHLIAVVAQGSPSAGGKYRLRMADTLIERVASWAERRNALVFLDAQIGHSTIEEELAALAKHLRRPNFHLGLDPEFAMKRGGVPGQRIGTLDASDINYAARFLAGLVEEHDLPPKVLVVHRFTRGMVTNARAIELDPRVQIVIHMDGWGPPRLKRDSYRSYVYAEPVQFTGFKLFYHNDTKAGHPLMTPDDILSLNPKPVYIQYQ